MRKMCTNLKAHICAEHCPSLLGEGPCVPHLGHPDNGARDTETTCENPSCTQG